MVRKQLYIEQDQEQALKARVQELGITEAQFVRQALDRALEQTLPSCPLSSKSGRLKVLERLNASWDKSAQLAQIEPNYKWKRDDAYDDPRYR